MVPLNRYLKAFCCLWVSLFTASAYETVASLDYGDFEGAYSSEYNISYWTKIPYAAPPTGQNRFRAPQPPDPVLGRVYNSSREFDMCPQRETNGSEDCLYLTLYSRPWSTGQSLRPVVVTFYGGGFVQGAAALTLPPSAYPILDVSEAADVVFVYPNYRVNAFGFLPGRQVRDDPLSDANAGLLDQRMALQWTHNYIEKFGGDPDNVAIWGQSAGGGSVLAQTLAGAHGKGVGERSDGEGRSGDGKRLFARAMASSPFWPKTYAVDDAEAQWRYDTLANLTGCAGANSLQCLKDVDVQMIRDASLVVVDGHKYDTSTFGWGPVIDGVFLKDPLSTAAIGRESVIMDGFGMYNTHEGESFVPDELNSTGTGDLGFNSSTASFEAWLAGYLPWFSATELGRVKELYPEAGSSETVPAYNDSYTRAGLIYRDSVLTCPAYWTIKRGSRGRWLGEYTIPPAKHASDVYWWNQVNSAQKEDTLHYEGYAGAMASFFMTGDPNVLRASAEDVPKVPELGMGDEWVIDSNGFKTTGIAHLEARCRFWREVGSKVPV
ncbi:putative carboxylesterase [Xylariaceae sp. FL0016]|nr:putative carboxylesterase [Xylariaceae sp. FL0016]